MSRHRNVRSMNYHEEVEGYDDVYGHSVEDDYCISPNTEAQFMYKRNDQTLSAFMNADENIQEDYESDDHARYRADSFSRSYQHKLNETDRVRLVSCMEEIRNIIGEAVPDHILEETILQHNFNFNAALDAILSGQDNHKEKKTSKKKSSSKGKFPEKLIPNASFVPKDNKSVNNTINATYDSLKQLNLSTNEKDTFSHNNSSFEKKSPQPDTAVHLKISSDENNIDNHCDSGKVSPRIDENLDKTPNAGKTPSSATKTPRSADRFDLQAELEKRKLEGKELINLVVIGHVDAGKSTLMGHLLYLLGGVNKKTMHKYETESKKLGKASFAYAWVLDETGEERSRGITMDVGQTRFETDHKIVTLLDAPGHKDFIPNMITGAAQADVAVLVVDATRGEFETGFESGGQTREHALLVRSLGVSQLAVAVNKLDTVEWSEERFQEICKKLGQFLKQAGYKDNEVVHIPLSGLTGENLIALSSNCPLTKWYHGHTLLQQIDNFKSPERSLDKPFRLCISDVFKGMTGGFCVSGKVEAGFIQNGDKILIMPSGETAQIKGIAIEEEPLSCALAGDFAVLTLVGVDMNNVSLGSVLCNITSPIKSATRIRARIVVFNIEIPITKGFPVVFHYKSLTEQATVRKLISQLHKSTGEEIKKRPRFLTKHSNALIELEIGRPVCVELYKDYKELGRFMLRSSGNSIAAGLVTEIL